MATTAWMAKLRKPQKFSTRFRNRCQICGRPRGFYRDFGLCRICLRKMTHEGLIPGMRKSSW
jgi:small subunit ribosomal protein S14